MNKLMPIISLLMVFIFYVYIIVSCYLKSESRLLKKCNNFFNHFNKLDKYFNFKYKGLDFKICIEVAYNDVNLKVYYIFINDEKVGTWYELRSLFRKLNYFYVDYDREQREIYEIIYNAEKEYVDKNINAQLTNKKSFFN